MTSKYLSALDGTHSHLFLEPGHLINTKGYSACCWIANNSSILILIIAVRAILIMTIRNCKVRFKLPKLNTSTAPAGTT